MKLKNKEKIGADYESVWVIEGKSFEVAFTRTFPTINTTCIWAKETMSLKTTQAEMLDIKPTATGDKGEGETTSKGH